MYRYEYDEYEYSYLVLDFRITNIRYWGGFGGAKPPREREQGFPTRASPNSVEAHHPL
jgi:hypothetical protein